MELKDIIVKYNLKENEIKQTKYSNYYITSFGRIINHRGLMLKTSIDRNGYSVYTLSIDGKPQFIQIHRLELETFHPIEDSQDLMVNHIDGNKNNNELSNLEWCSRSENALHSFKNGLQNKVSNQYGTYKVLTTEEKIFIRDNYNIYSQTELAEKLGVCRRTIRKYKDYKEKNYEI